MMLHLLVVSCLITSCYGAKLNVPKILLPYYSSVATNYSLEVSEGCYKWRSSRSEVATVMPLIDGAPAEPEACSRQAVVTAVSKTPSRVTSVVMAEDPISGQQLRCDVIVDVIHSIHVETTTRELYLEDSPEEFNLKALDDEGNVFSTLEGVSFEWSLVSDTDVEQDSIVDAHNVLRIIPFWESSYDTPTHIAALESRGKQGDTLLVEGLRTGSAKVNARLVDAIYSKRPESTVRLIVIANIVLNPPLIYMMKNTQVQYHVELLKQGKVHEIPMPSAQYYLDLKDPALCSLNSQTSVVTAKEMGYTEIVLKDKNIKVKEAFRQPVGAIHIVAPGYLGFVVLPGRKWVLETQRTYEILIEVFDKDSHRIFPSDNVRVVAHFPPEYFHVYSSSTNGTYHVVKTLKRGNTLIDGLLRAVILQDGTEVDFTPVVKGNQDCEIYDPIAVIPPVLVFAWEPNQKATYHYPLTATGGSGNYTWSSTDSSVASVNVRGVISTAAIGETRFTAADVRNAAHTGSMVTYVVPPSAMEFVPSPVEAEIGSTLELPLAIFGMIKDKKKERFVDCRQLPINVQIGDSSVFSHIPEVLPLRDDSCATIKVRAKKLGHTAVTVSYEGERVKLSASVTIAAYDPLQAIDPSLSAVVVIGSSKEVLFQGGPQPWVLDTSKYYRKATMEKTDLVKMTPLRGFAMQKNQHMFLVVCQGLGEQELTVTVGNGETSKNRFPASAATSIQFVCAPPVGIELRPVIRLPADQPPCPITLDSLEPIPVPNYRDLEVTLSVTDSNGRKFDNFSSLAITWDVSDMTIAVLDADGKSTTDVQLADAGHKYSVKNEMFLMQEKVGHFSITASILGYDKAYLKGITMPDEIDPPITSTIHLSAVTDAAITPDFIYVFNHPSSKAKLQLSGGSGYFKMTDSTGPSSPIAAVDYDRRKQTIEVTPLHDGQVTITATDLCIDSVTPAHSHMHISGVNTVVLHVIDKVELGKEIKALVGVMDKSGKPLLATYFPLMGLQPVPGSDIISLRPDPEPVDDPYRAQYIVYGESLGRTTLQFTAKPQSSQVVMSATREIQVFPPLRLDPRNITILVGALFQVTAHGGPPQSTIEYAIDQDDIATISHSGLVDAKEVGVTRVTGHAVGYEGDSGRVIVYSQDEVIVNVVELEGIRIHAPLKRLKNNAWMPLYAVGIQEYETPFTFGSAVPPLLFRWTINNKDAGKLQNVFHKSGIRASEESNFAVQLFAKQAGTVTVSLTVSPSPGSQMQIRNNAGLHDEVQIQVFEELQLTNPDACSGTILITPNTETYLRTNRDSTARMTYEVISGSHIGIVSVTKAGQLVSGSRTGQVTLRVTSHEDFGVNQTLVILVKVKPVSYLTINTDTVIRTGQQKLVAIPVGANIHFTVSFHDDVGEQFFATNSHLRYRLNRFDLLSITPGAENGTLLARTVNVGQTILKVWDEYNPYMADYINIKVDYAIEPAQTQLTLGDIACFTSPIISPSGQHSMWSTTTAALDLQSSSGIATAAQIGSTVVRYEVPNSMSNSLTTDTEVTVVPVSKIHLRNNNVQHLTNVVGRNKATVVPVVLESSSVNRYNNLVGANCSNMVGSEGYQPSYLPFLCDLSMTTHHPDISAQDLFHTVARFDSQTGQYECQMTQKATSDMHHVISNLDTTMQLRAIVSGRDGQHEVVSGVTSLPFLPAFFVHTPEVTLSNLQPVTNVRISAIERIIEDIKVSSSDSTLLEVLPAEMDAQSRGTVVFPIHLLEQRSQWDFDNFDIMIEVLCVATGQRQEIPVRIKLIGNKDGAPAVCPGPQVVGWGGLLQVIADNYETWMIRLLCILATIAALFISYHAVMGTRYRFNSQHSAFLQPGQSPNASGYRPSPWSSPYGTGISQSRVPLWSLGYDSSGSPTGRPSLSGHDMNGSASSIAGRTSPGHSACDASGGVFSPRRTSPSQSRFDPSGGTSPTYQPDYSRSAHTSGLS